MNDFTERDVTVKVSELLQGNTYAVHMERHRAARDILHLLPAVPDKAPPGHGARRS